MGIRRRRLAELVAGVMLVVQSVYGLADETLSEADQRRSTGEALQDGTESFLSDPGRVGAIAGSIAAGAAFANPIAPLVGNVAGFVIGKSSDYSSDEQANGRSRHQERNIIPAEAEGQAQSPELLALSGGDEPQPEVHFPAQPVPVPVGYNGQSDEQANGNGNANGRESTNGLDEEETVEGSWALADRDASVIADRRQVNGVYADSQRHLSEHQEMQERKHCPATAALQYRKRVAVTSFAMVRKEDATMGGLQDVQRKLPQKLHAHLARDRDVIALSATERRIFRSAADFPTERRPDRRLSQASRLTQEMDAQFVVSGVVRDMSVVDPQSWGTSKLRQWGRAFGRGDRERRFVVDLYVHDGMSGALVMEQRFETAGEWDFEPSRRVGFGTREFDRSDYGENVADLVEEMARELTDRVACQPFMAQVQRVDDTRIRIASGAESGLRPGDELALYRSLSFMDQRDANPELRDTGHRMVVQQVQPQYASGTLPIEGPRMNVQRGDVVVIW